MGRYSLTGYVAFVNANPDQAVGANTLANYWNDVEQYLVQEDLDSFLLIDQLNVVNHFWDPYNDVTIQVTGFPGLIESAKDRADRLFPNAIQQYQSGRYPEAFQSLGRVCHLVQDMSCPAHTLLDPHLERANDVWGRVKQWVGTHVFTLANACDPLLYDDADLLHQYANIPGRRVHWDGFSPIAAGGDLVSIMRPLARLSKGFDSDDCDGTVDLGSRRYQGLSGPELDEIIRTVMPEGEKSVAAVFKLFFEYVRPPTPVLRQPEEGKIYSGLAGVPLHVEVRPPQGSSNLRSLRIEYQDQESTQPDQWHVIKAISIMGDTVVDERWFNTIDSGQVTLRTVAVDAAACESLPDLVNIKIDSTPPMIWNKRP